jgi:sugar-specific transcriptional regulator TrmB
MLIRDQQLQVLTKLGLTVCQAKIYLTLVKHGKCTAFSISKYSKSPREYIYQTLPSLEKLGLIEKEISRPTMFKAVPIQVGMSFLMEQRKKENCSLENQAKKIIQEFGKYKEETQSEFDDKILVISGKKRKMWQTINEVKNSRRNIKGISSYETLFSWLFIQEELYSEALDRGLDVRFIVDQSELNIEIPKVVDNLKTKSKFGLRFVRDNPRVHLGIYDGKRGYISSCSSKTLTGAPIYQTRNPCMISLMNAYFEVLWITAMENPIYSIDENLI